MWRPLGWSILILIAVTGKTGAQTNYKPVFMVHGVSSNSSRLEYLANRIQQAHPGTTVYATNAYPGRQSTTPLPDQIEGDLGEEFQNFSSSYPGGFHLIGYSQGGILSRGLLETYASHNVQNFIAISSPLAGQYGPMTLMGATIPVSIAYLVLYNPLSQRSFSIANFWNDPNHQNMYLSMSNYLPYIDNEVKSSKSESYKQGFTKVKRVIMIGGPDDGVISPWQSSHFSFVDQNDTIVKYNDRQAYLEDWFGLRTLDEQRKLQIYERSGIDHSSWVVDDGVIDEYIIPHLD